MLHNALILALFRHAWVARSDDLVAKVHYRPGKDAHHEVESEEKKLKAKH